MLNNNGGHVMPEQREKRRGLPRGQNALPRHVVAMTQRRRLHEAVIAAVAERGYANMTVADIIREAAVSRSTFYEHFSDRDDCFLSAYDEEAAAGFQAVLLAGARAPDDPFERLRVSVRTYLEVLAARPEYARAFTIEILAAGQAGYEHRRRAQARYVDSMRAWHGQMRKLGYDAPPLPNQVFEAAVTAGNEIIAEQIRTTGGRGLLELEDLIVYTYLSLMGFGEQAAASLSS